MVSGVPWNVHTCTRTHTAGRGERHCKHACSCPSLAINTTRPPRADTFGPRQRAGPTLGAVDSPASLRLCMPVDGQRNTKEDMVQHGTCDGISDVSAASRSFCVRTGHGWMLMWSARWQAIAGLHARQELSAASSIPGGVLEHSRHAAARRACGFGRA